MRVLVFGASITQGFWDLEGGWVARLRKYYDERQFEDLRSNDEPTIFNLGISGDNTHRLLRRFKNEIAARVIPGSKPAIIISIGTNNALIKSDGKNQSEPGEYTQDLRKIIDIAREFSDKIMFVELLPCDEKLTRPVFWQNITYANDRLELFNKAMRQLATEQRISYVPMFEEFQKRLEAGEKLLADGLHPNNDGHKLMFELIQPELDKLLA
jgi:lysophospholipase L1-like esterase